MLFQSQVARLVFYLTGQKKKGGPTLDATFTLHPYQMIRQQQKEKSVIKNKNNATLVHVCRSMPPFLSHCLAGVPPFTDVAHASPVPLNLSLAPLLWSLTGMYLSKSKGYLQRSIENRAASGATELDTAL